MLQTNVPHCPFCPMIAREVFVARGHAVWECESCDYRFCDPREITNDHLTTHYADEYFFGGGAGYHDYLSERELLVQHGQRYGDLLNKYVSPGSLLDVGAAAGFLMQGLSQAGWQPVGIEPNARMCEFARREFDYSMHCGALENCSLQKQFDVITMIQVVAHFRDLRLALDAAAEHTKPGGYWLIESWNFRSLTARALGKHWHEYSPPTVQHWFSPRGLEDIGKQYGMQLVGKGRPKKYINGEHAKSLLRYRLETSLLGRVTSSALHWLPDRLRLRYLAEDLFWILLRKQG